MFDAFVNGLLLVLQWKPFLYMMIGGAIGFWVGILPGLGGGTTLALMLPFIYKMTPQEAFPFLLGMHSVTATTGDITSVLFGIPGERSEGEKQRFALRQRGDDHGACKISSGVSGEGPGSGQTARGQIFFDSGRKH